jgi:hypothetical protein
MKNHRGRNDVQELVAGLGKLADQCARAVAAGDPAATLLAQAETRARQSAAALGSADSRKEAARRAFAQAGVDLDTTYASALGDWDRVRALVFAVYGADAVKLAAFGLRAPKHGGGRKKQQSQQQAHQQAGPNAAQGAALEVTHE